MKLVSRADYARWAGISDAAVSKLCKKRLADACVNKRIDVDHPAVLEHLESKGVDPTTGPPAGRKVAERAAAPRRSTPKKVPAKPTGPAPETVRQREFTRKELERFDEMRLRDLVAEFGTVPAFLDHLNALKRLEDVREKALKNDDTEGSIISRELVQGHVFGALYGLSSRLLGDMPKTVAQQLYALAKTGAPLEEAEKVVRDAVSSQIEPVKVKVSKALGGEGAATKR